MAGAKIMFICKTSKSDVDKKTIKKWEMDFEQDSIEFFVINSDSKRNHFRFYLI
jgi:hypothetical protein